jgi:succinate dehydrogenase / fumarate reductase cytochrome b subunit
VALYVGLLIVAAWAVALAGGPELYADYMGLMSSLLGRLVLFGLTLAVWYHTVGGIRHLTFDAGRGYHPRTANQTGWAVIAFTVLASVLTWLAAAQIGAL